MKSAKQKINTKNASDDEAVIGALLEAYPVNKKLIMNLFKHSVNTSSIERLVEQKLLDEQIAYCERNKIQMTTNFKNMLHNVTYRSSYSLTFSVSKPTARRPNSFCCDSE